MKARGEFPTGLRVFYKLQASVYDSRRRMRQTMNRQ